MSLLRRPGLVERAVREKGSVRARQGVSWMEAASLNPPPAPAGPEPRHGVPSTTVTHRHLHQSRADCPSPLGPPNAGDVAEPGAGERTSVQ